VKKIKIVLLAFIIFFGFSLNIYANENYSVSLTDKSYDWQEKFVYEIIINSNKLPQDTKVEAYNDGDNFTYIDEDLALNLEKLYKYELKNSSNIKITELDEEIEILIYQEGLKEGTKYNVYYFDEVDYKKILDKTHLKDKAEVVKKDDKLYIRLVTSTLKYFALEKEMSKEYKESLDKILDNGYFIFPAVKPIRTIEYNFDFYTLFEAYNSDKHGIEIWPAEELNLSKDFHHMTLKFDNIKDESHVVKYKWQTDTIPSNLKGKFDKIEKNILKNNQPLDKIAQGHNGVYFEIADLNYINYLKNNNPYNQEIVVFESVVNYSNELKEVFENSNFKYYFDFRAGNTEPFFKVAFGFMSVGYNDLIYSLNFDAGFYVKQVIYIPDDTEDTDEAYIAAAKKRITEYLGIDDIKIEVGGTREAISKEFELDRREVWKDFYDEEKLSDNYYIVSINGMEEHFVFEKNTKKINEIEFKTKDLESDVEINSSSGKIPLDTLIEVDIIGKNHKEFKEILEILKKEDGMIYDLKLYSETLQKYITKLDNGKFKVRIPIKKELQNQKLKAYYITDEKEIEEYNVLIENGYAVFETDHFSTYTIAKAGETPNPETYNGITIYIFLGIISFIGLLGITTYIKKYNN